MTPFEAKGWKSTDKFRVVESTGRFKADEIVTLRKDDNSSSPSFVNDDGDYWFVELKRLERIEPEWNGEGLPPVGTECECSYDGDPYLRTEVVAVTEKMIVIANKNNLGEDAFYHYQVKFRPIRSEREKAIDEMMKVVDHGLPSKELVARLYDAGYRKP